MVVTLLRGYEIKEFYEIQKVMAFVPLLHGAQTQNDIVTKN